MARFPLCIQDTDFLDVWGSTTCSVPYLPSSSLFQDDELSYALGKQGGTRKKLERASGGENFGKDLDVPKVP